MNIIYDNREFWRRLLDLLQNQFGPTTEFVLHEHVRNDYSHSIVDIRNGQITGREIGGCGSNLGLEVFRGIVNDRDRYNYITTTKDGKVLRSSTMFLEDENGTITGSLCINTDITETLRMEEYLKQYNHINDMSTGASVVNLATQAQVPDISEISANLPKENVEFFAQDVSQVLDYLIDAAQKHVGKPVSAMKRDDKIEFIRYMDSKGAFLIIKSSEYVYEYLKISRYTFYKYLDEVHGGTLKKRSEYGKTLPAVHEKEECE